MARIFLSHANADKPIVRRISAALRQAGYEPWLDEDQIIVGDSIPRALAAGMLKAIAWVDVSPGEREFQRGLSRLLYSIKTHEERREGMPELPILQPTGTP